jgi:hypothetical protein
MNITSVNLQSILVWDVAEFKDLQFSPDRRYSSLNHRGESRLVLGQVILGPKLGNCLFQSIYSESLQLETIGADPPSLTKIPLNACKVFQLGGPQNAIRIPPRLLVTTGRRMRDYWHRHERNLELESSKWRDYFVCIWKIFWNTKFSFFQHCTLTRYLTRLNSLIYL